MKQKSDVFSFLMLSFGTIILFLSFTVNNISVLSCDVSSSGDQLIITGAFSSFFILSYGLGLCLVYYSLFKLMDYREYMVDDVIHNPDFDVVVIVNRQSGATMNYVWEQKQE